MNERQGKLLGAIVLTYIKTAEPVGSKWLSERGSFGVSPATIRNDMAALETDGYLTQPHTSSGRVPTEKGYQYFIQHSLEQRQPDARHARQLEEAATHFENERDLLKSVSRMIAQFSSNAAFVAFGPNDVYTTGLSRLFAQPEYSEHETVRRMSLIVDRLDEVLTAMFPTSEDSIAILIGSQNPLGSECGTLLMRYRTPEGQGLLGVLGPVRMDYQRNLALLRHSQHIFDTLFE